MVFDVEEEVFPTLSATLSEGVGKKTQELKSDNKRKSADVSINIFSLIIFKIRCTSQTSHSCCYKIYDATVKFCNASVDFLCLFLEL